MARRLAFSPQHRSLFVTSQKVKSIRNLIGQDTAKEIHVSCMDHTQKGQMTKRFKALEDAGEFEARSMSLVYRETNGALESLDLVVPDPRDYGNLLTALEDLISIYAQEKQYTDRDILLLRHYWIEMGKEEDSSLSQGEWMDLCDRLQVSLKGAKLGKLYRDFYKELKKQLDKPMDGLPLWAVSELIQDLRYHNLEHAGLKLVRDDPQLRLWHSIFDTDPVPSLRMAGEDDDFDTPTEYNSSSNYEKSISSVAFLSFIRSQQKQFKASLENALGLMHILNHQTSVRELSGDQDDDQESTKDDRLSKTRFFQYLLSDANDLLDPRKGKIGCDDMTHPLSHYWISSSHDTYWNGWKGTIDEQIYLAALYRGVRCLELDVWDGENGEPVLCREKPTDGDEFTLDVPVVLKIVRHFLLANPKAFPVILNIENHCSFKFQEKLAKHLFNILGSIGLIVVPDESDSVDEADLLPSPASMMGKVLVMGKRPKVVEDGARVVNDDFDDENDVYINDALPNARSREDEAQILGDTGIVIGFDAAGPIKIADDKMQECLVKHTPGELLYMSTQELEKAKVEAADAEIKALTAADEAVKAEKHSDKLIHQAGLSKEAVWKLANEVKGVEIDPVEHVALLSRVEGEGVEIQEFFADAVVANRHYYTEADSVAIEAATIATVSLQRLNAATIKLREAEYAMEKNFRTEQKLYSKNKWIASDARSKREHADHAQRRIEKLQQLLAECEDSANSAENVVVTAMTEAKISEKRATEIEARAARAASKAQDGRAQADEETRKEEDLERKAGALHEKMVQAANEAKDARERMDKAAAMLDRVKEQIKLIEQSTQYIREKQEALDNHEEKKEAKTVAKSGSLISKHTFKIEERRLYTECVRKSSLEVSDTETKRRAVQDAFERTAHEWKNSTEIASKARKQSDRSSHQAEELAEHADEEREAANLRKVARDRAKSNVKDKDSYRTSLTAQLAEAERAAAEAEEIAGRAILKAESQTAVNEPAENYKDLVHLLQRRKAARDHALQDYQAKKRVKEEADEKSAEAKRLVDTSEDVYSNAMRNAAKDQRIADVQKFGDRKALVAFNRARLAQKQAEHALEKARYAQSVVTEKQVIVKRAKEYKEKTDHISEIPISLAKMTFLHTTKHRYWDKSLDLPNTHVHSFAQSVLDQMIKNDPHNPEKMKEFTSEHVCRTFPSVDKENNQSKNIDPLFQWSMGCQLVSMNFTTFDNQVIKADGKFRRNGSCGFVLKPKFLTNYDTLPERSEGWTINILCGHCLPSPETKKSSGPINPFVKITVYGGDIEQKSAEHRTKVVLKNGLNPVWDDKKGFTFTARSPSLSIISFSVWHKSEAGEEFIAASAMPVSCMREGYRSVALFDRYNTRSRAHAYASLLVRAQANS